MDKSSLFEVIEMNDGKSLILKKDNIITKVFSFIKNLFKKLDSKMNEVFEDEKAKNEDIILADTIFKMDEIDEDKTEEKEEKTQELDTEINEEKNETDETNGEGENVSNSLDDDFRKKYIKLYFQVRDDKIPVEVLSFDELFMLNALFDSEIKLLKE